MNLGKVKSVFKAIVEIIVYGRSKGYWSRGGEPTKAMDVALAGTPAPEPDAEEFFGDPLIERLLRWFDGKKTYTGLALYAAGAIIAALSQFLGEAGFTVAEFAKWSGVFLLALGTIHKIVKIADDLTPDPPDKALPR